MTKMKISFSAKKSPKYFSLFVCFKKSREWGVLHEHSMSLTKIKERLAACYYTCLRMLQANNFQFERKNNNATETAATTTTTHEWEYKYH